MRQPIRIPVHLALASILGLAMCVSAGFGAAQAQDKMSKDKIHSDMMMETGYEDEMGMPVSPAYPMAAPGSLDLNHWSDFRRMHMMPGSASEAMMDKRAMHEGHRMDSMEDDEDMVPATPMYPYVAPGAIDMVHWSDYRHMHMRSGSATEAAMDKMHDKDRMHMDHMMHEEDEEDLAPTSPGYPYAAPGSLDLNHWTDYTRMHMAPGSATEAKMDKMHMKDEKRMK